MTPYRTPARLRAFGPWLPLGVLAAVVLLLSCPHLHAQEYNEPFSPPAVSSAVLLESDNYDTASEGTNCASSTKIDITSGSPNCDFNTRAISGTESLEIGSTELAAYNVTATTDGTVEFRGFVFIDVGGSAGSTLGECISLSKGTVRAVFIDCRDFGSTTVGVRIRTVDTTGSETTGLTGDIWYKFCLRYDVDNDDGEAYLDPQGGTFCAGASWSATADNTVTDVTQIDRGYFTVGSGSAASAALDLDDIEIYDNG